jgi:drug/metabolite transporter (DMT)-like permease
MKKSSWFLALGIHFFLEWLFPIFSYFALIHLSILWFVALSVFIALVFWVGIMIKQKLYREYKNKEILSPMLLSVFFLGIWGILYFFAIKYSSPSTASILLLTQTFFAFVLFNILWKEKYTIRQIIWAIFMLIWGITILYKGQSFYNLWVIIMIITCIFFTFWNFYVKRASLRWANPFFLLVNRNLFMFMLTTLLAFIFVWPVSIEVIKQNLIWIFFVWFFVLFLGKILWIIALSQLDSFVAISSYPIVPFLVMIFSFFILKKIPSPQEILWFIPLAIGSILLVKK